MKRASSVAAIPASTKGDRAIVTWALWAAGSVVTACASNGAGLAKVADPGGAASAMSPDDSDLPSLLPPGLAVAIDVNLQSLRDSPWTAESLQSRDAGEHATKIAALGYDDAADVDRMEYAVTALDGAPPGPMLVVAQGRFVPATVTEAFQSRWPGATVETVRGIPMTLNERNALAFIGARTFVSGTPEDVRGVIDRALRHPSGVSSKISGSRGTDAGDAGLGTLRRALGGALADVLPGGTPAVLAVTVMNARMRARLSEMFSLPSTMTHFGVRMDLGRSLTLTALVLAQDRPAAAELAHRLTLATRETKTRLMVAAVGLSPILNNLDIATDGARVRITSTVDENDRAEVRQALQALVRLLRAR